MKKAVMDSCIVQSDVRNVSSEWKLLDRLESKLCYIHLPLKIHYTM